MSQASLFNPHHSTATITLFFNEPLVEDPAAKFQMFYAAKWGTEAAEPVVDINGDKVYGEILSNKLTFTIPIQTFPTEITVVALGLNIAQWTQSDYVIFNAIPEYTHRLWVAAQKEAYYGPPGGDLDDNSDPVDPLSDLKDNDLI